MKDHRETRWPNMWYNGWSLAPDPLIHPFPNVTKNSQAQWTTYPACLTVTLNDGSRVPWLAFGTGTALFGRDAAASVQLAIDNGITHLDGAQMYSNEESLAAGIKASGKPRSELYIVTKLSDKNPRPGQTVKESLLESLERLKVDYVDMFLIHSPIPSHVNVTLKALWQGMEEVHKAGLAKSIGVSNFRVPDLKVILDGANIIPAVNQIELHPYVWKAAEPIVNFCKENGIAIESYGGQSPIVRTPGGPLGPILAEIRARLEETRGEPVSSGQVLSKWILQRGAYIVTTTSKASRIKEFLDTPNVPDLTTEEIRVIDDTGSKLHKRVYMNHIFTEEM